MVKGYIRQFAKKITSSYIGRRFWATRAARKFYGIYYKPQVEQ